MSPHSIQSDINWKLTGKTFEMIAKTFYGLEETLESELVNLGATNVRRLNRAVGFKGNKALLYKANYCLRTALKILVPLKEAVVRDEHDLYNAIKNIPWEGCFDLESTFAVEAVLKSSVFSHSHYIEQRVKDAIVDRFRDLVGKRPSVDSVNPHVKIHVNVAGKDLRLSLDSSGHALFKRGYRVMQGPAPLNEVLAAGLVILSGWQYGQPLVDFMCGSGTIPIEAALMASATPPGALERQYGFQYWKDYDRELFNQIKNNIPVRDPSHNIYASDRSKSAIYAATTNAKQVNAAKHLVFSTTDLHRVSPPESAGMVIINPPYGERLKQENLNDLYKSIGDKLKNDFQGYEAWIFSGNKEALKHVGLHPSRKITLFNGPLECKFQLYRMYAGSKKKQPDRRS